MKNTIELIKELALAYDTKDRTKLDLLVHSEDIKWDFFIEQSVKHKLTPLAFIVLKQYFEEVIPLHISEWLSNQYYVNKHRTELTTTAIRDFMKIIIEKEIPAVVVKGIGIDAMLYKTDFVKQISDVDILINEEDASSLINVIRECGFIEGNYNYKENCIEPMPRKRKILFCLTKDHLSEYLLETKDSIFPTVKVDVSFNNDWIERGTKSCFTEAIKDPLLLELESNIKIPVMKATYHFLYLIMHLYRHACSYRFIERGIGVRLSMFNDVMLFYNKHKAVIKREFNQVVRDEKIKMQVEWVLYHLDKIYNCNICGQLNISCNSKNLNEVYGKNNEMITWSGGIEERLWRSSEKELLFKR